MNKLAARLSHPDTGLLLARVWLGFIGVFHGAQKLFGLAGGPGIRGFAGVLEGMNVPAPTLSAILAGAAEFFGGLLLALGILPRLAAVPFIFTMLVAFLVAHGGRFAVTAGGGEYALTIAVLLLATIMTGPGRYTVPNLLRRGAARPIGRPLTHS